MPRQRLKENVGLPKRWRLKHGAYYYQVPPGLEHQWKGKKLFRLGKTLPEAYSQWANRLEHQENSKTVGDLLDNYLVKEVPKKALSTHRDLKRYIHELHKVFGHMDISSIEPRHIYQFYQRKGEKKTATKRAIEVFSAAYTKAVEWGFLSRHPFKGEVRLEGFAPRVRYVEDWEVAELFKVKNKRPGDSIETLHAYIKLKLLTGMSKKDLLLLKEDQIDKEGIHIQRYKTRHSSGKRTVYQWCPELKMAIEEARKARRAKNSPYIFCTRKGSTYYSEEFKASGFDSIWRKFMKRVFAETKLQKHFTEHDLRAKVASDAKSLDHARALLSHSNQKITEQVYRRAPERVEPLKYDLNSTKGIE